MVQQSAATQGSVLQTTLSGGNARPVLPAGQLKELGVPSAFVSAHVRGTPGAVQLRLELLEPGQIPDVTGTPRSLRAGKPNQ